ncbi:MAG: hypothetical protein ACLUOI_20760 [Eisenbergiella sp.]
MVQNMVNTLAESVKEYENFEVRNGRGPLHAIDMYHKGIDQTPDHAGQGGNCCSWRRVVERR